MNLTLSELRCHYRGSDRPAVEIAHLDLAAGPVGLVGVNGAGKTLLLRTLAGARRPEEGRVLVDGEPLYGARRRQVSAGIGYMPHELRLPGELTAAQVLAYRTADTNESQATCKRPDH